MIIKARKWLFELKCPTRIWPWVSLQILGGPISIQIFLSDSRVLQSQLEYWVLVSAGTKNLGFLSIIYLESQQLII